jgi:DNA polymerase I
MIDVQRVLDERRARGGRARMILTVHDELLFEVPREETEEVEALVRVGMEGAAQLSVPLTVDVGVGANWTDAKG